MGLRRTWVATCDALCDAIITLDVGPSDVRARMRALEHDWECVVRADDYGTRAMWFCPEHRLSASVVHEEWCPRQYGSFLCSCHDAEMLAPGTFDEAVSMLPPMLLPRAIQEIRPRGDIL